MPLAYNSSLLCTPAMGVIYRVKVRAGAGERLPSPRARDFVSYAWNRLDNPIGFNFFSKSINLTSQVGKMLLVLKEKIELQRQADQMAAKMPFLPSGQER